MTDCEIPFGSEGTAYVSHDQSGTPSSRRGIVTSFNTDPIISTFVGSVRILQLISNTVITYDNEDRILNPGGRDISRRGRNTRGKVKLVIFVTC